MNITNNKTYKHYLAEVNDHIEYIGPRSIFDPNFIPSKYIPREKITNYIDGIMTDALFDGYATNVNLYGLQGAGKNLAVNHYLQWALDFYSLSSETPELPAIYIIRADCVKRNENQVLFQLVSQLGPLIHPLFSARKAVSLNSLTLWNLFKILIEKAHRPVILYLQHSESLSHTFISKLFIFSKSCKNLQIFTTFDAGMQRYHFKQYESMDHKLQFDNYSVRDIYEITRDRVKMAVPNPISPNSIELIVDFVGEFDMFVPGASINLIKELYPSITQNKELSAETIRGICQYHFDGFSLDAYQMADFVVNSSIEDRLFLENLISQFQKQDSFYIFMPEIKKAYKMVCDDLGFPIIQEEMHESLKKIVDNNILCKSKYYQYLVDCKKGKSKNYGYFLTVPIQEATDLMRVSFKNYFEDDDNQNFPDSFGSKPISDEKMDDDDDEHEFF